MYPVHATAAKKTGQSKKKNVWAHQKLFFENFFEKIKKKLNFFEK